MKNLFLVILTALIGFSSLVEADIPDPIDGFDAGFVGRGSAFDVTQEIRIKDRMVFGNQSTGPSCVLKANSSSEIKLPVGRLIYVIDAFRAESPRRIRYVFAYSQVPGGDADVSHMECMGSNPSEYPLVSDIKKALDLQMDVIAFSPTN